MKKWLHEFRAAIFIAISSSFLLAGYECIRSPSNPFIKEYYGITPKLTVGVMPVEQDPALFDRLHKELQAKHEIELAVVWMMTKHLASLLLALSVAENQLNADDAFTRSRIEELVQNERWGEDEEAVARRRAAQDDMRRLGDYYRLLSVK